MNILFNNQPKKIVFLPKHLKPKMTFCPLSNASYIFSYTCTSSPIQLMYFNVYIYIYVTKIEKAYLINSEIQY
jgi:hypothetical protein